MTCIVGVAIPGEGAVLGSDSVGVGGHHCTDIATPKLYQLRPWLAIGFTTSWRYGQVLGHHLNDELGLSSVELQAIRDNGELDWAVRSLVPAMRKVLKDAGYATREHEHEEAGDAIVAARDQVFRVHDDYAITMPRQGVAACGSGANAAMVAAAVARDIDPTYHASDLVGLALRHAELATPFVRGPFSFVTTTSMR